MSNNSIIGALGEDIACRFLEKKGFKVVERNYRKKWGEIDIVAHETKKYGWRGKTRIHFVEVKSVSCEINKDVIRETLKSHYRPEDAVHALKVKRLVRAIQSYLIENNKKKGLEWQFDIIAVFVDTKNKNAKIRFIEKLIL